MVDSVGAALVSLEMSGAAVGVAWVSVLGISMASIVTAVSTGSAFSIGSAFSTMVLRSGLWVTAATTLLTSFAVRSPGSNLGAVRLPCLASSFSTASALALPSLTFRVW